jgi:hypothetical protein
VAITPRIPTTSRLVAVPCGPLAQPRRPVGGGPPPPKARDAIARCVGIAAMTTTLMMNRELSTRQRVPPKPAAIFAGEDSLRSGIRAPSPTAIPESPMQSTTQQTS